MKLTAERAKKAEKTIEKVKTIFIEDQITRLENPDANTPLSSTTIQNCIQDYYKIGSKSYEHMRLRMKKIIPHIDTLRRHLRKIQTKPGIWHDIMTLLKIKTKDLPKYEKTVSLICDEMSLKSKIEYDMTTQSYVGYVRTPISQKM